MAKTIATFTQILLRVPIKLEKQVLQWSLSHGLTRTAGINFILREWLDEHDSTK